MTLNESKAVMTATQDLIQAMGGTLRRKADCTPEQVQATNALLEMLATIVTADSVHPRDDMYNVRMA